MTTYTAHTAAAALAAGGATIESIAAETGWPIVDDCLVPDPGTWHADDGNAAVTYDDVATGRQAAQRYVEEGDWGDDRQSATSWVTVYSWRAAIDSDGHAARVDEGRHKIALEAVEPACVDGDLEHDWQSPLELVGGCTENPGVYGHGGGVTITEVCMHCGCERVLDTWAQDPDDGQQGLRSTSYEPGRYREALERLREEAE